VHSLFNASLIKVLHSHELAKASIYKPNVLRLRTHVGHEYASVSLPLQYQTLGLEGSAQVGGDHAAPAEFSCVCQDMVDGKHLTKDRTKGARVTENTLSRRLYGWVRKSALKKQDLKPHDLRRTFGTWYLQEKPGQVRELAELMGHSDLSQVIKYALSDEKRARRAGVAKL
jgi:integrase